MVWVGKSLKDHAVFSGLEQGSNKVPPQVSFAIKNPSVTTQRIPVWPGLGALVLSHCESSLEDKELSSSKENIPE